MRANRKRIIFTKITVNVCAFCLLDKLTVNGYHIATMNEAERLTEKENNMKYFTNVNSLDELKKEYRRLVLKHHPDCGGDTETMKQINIEYEQMHEQLKHAWNTTHDAEHQCTEAPEEFRDIIEALLKMDGVAVELCGCWLWLSGNTYAYKDQLKALGCSWASKKKMWSWHHKEDGSRFYRGKRSMSEIRSKYGSQLFTADGESSGYTRIGATA